MNKLLGKLSLLPLLLAGILPAAQAQNEIPRPKLVIGMAVDQMRWDYLYRYYDRYGNDGFKRLLNEGFACQNTMIDYLPSFTAPGHASIFTGSVPSIHGIAGNDWIDNQTGTAWYCTDDPAVQGVGGSQRAGRMSPQNLLASTITDELRLATNFRSRVFGVSLKDRACILPAGRLANGAFWYDDSTGNFMSSTFYMQQLPDWLRSFNKKKYPDALIRKNWTLQESPRSYRHSLPDNNPYEGLFRGEKESVFPHRTEEAAGKDYGIIRRMPQGNTLTLRLAQACIEGERLGEDNTTDFLTVNLASTDYAGHQYGPNALEMEDLYLRLDQDLASFLSFLDKEVGKGNYLLFLTADHGGAHNPRFLADSGMHAGNVRETALKNELNAWLKKELGQDSLVRGLENYQVFFNEAGKVEKGKVKEAAMRWLKAQAGVAYVIDMADMEDTPVPQPIREMVINGYHRRRSGEVQIVMEPGWFHGYAPTGTTHGTWNPYDTHIPLLFFGWNIHKGETFRTTHMTDIAATVAALLHIQMPNGCIGHVIGEVMQ